MSLIDLFAPRRHTPMDAMADQLDTLRRDIRRVSRQVASRAGDTADDVGEVAVEFGREAARRGAHLAGVASRQAIKGAEAVRRDPVPIIALVGTALLLAHLLSRR
ncbi:hypothetical protein [Devosia sp. 63-57]|uniref:hypothetical protein n=1 Tax=Devosia sp. 63-57 TaxID=1895751 RepID=UPI00086BBBB6|nr:hypothetical protein [Devosia sp. 63-57]ODT50180.1 MAG: hypothetical protein ABS74_04465 [Pelagibacterium sp. SCN 63-126]ODU84610.1 MAG: hypothetical protein ABT14_13970 [Pelagibacterium sp. SCN 63-17]OJX44924.1 MAG: hypothetical protein BGO80_03465 [Devosia sp. 63-57]